MRKRLKCGCYISIADDGSIQLPAVEETNLNCPVTWDLISRGHTWGIFQLEKGLGQKYSKMAMPSNIEELSTLLAIIRPGCLGVILDDNKNLTTHYCMRKNGQEKAVPLHSSVENILKSSQQIIVMQEQALQIAGEIAGMSADDADIYIRKGIGKKLINLIQEGKRLFINGAKKKGIVDEETANKIFEGIEAAARYSFNASHSLSYAYNAYTYSAYIKAHFPRTFYMSKLEFIKTATESTEIINDAKKLGINIIKPDIRYFNTKAILVEDDILYPLGKIKYVGDNILKPIFKSLKKYKKSPTYKEWLLDILDKPNIRGARALIFSGAIDYLGISRSRMSADLEAISELKEDIKEHCLTTDGEILDILKDVLKQGTGKGKLLPVSKSKNKIIDCIANLTFNKNEKDTPKKIARWEREYIGRELTCVDISEFGNTNCRELSLGSVPKNIMIPGIINDWREFKTKNNELFGFLTIYDISGQANNIMVGSKELEKYKDMLYIDNKVYIKGQFSHKREILNVKEIVQI